MKKFRELLLDKLDKDGTSLKSVADGSGVSYEQLKKLKQGVSVSTNVDDAFKIAKFLKLNLHDFISRQDPSANLDEEEKDLADLVRLLKSLYPETRGVLRPLVEAQLAAQETEAQRRVQE
ncbi:MAG: hypothetical protein AAF198_06375 [Pseudomonadota bacterium]